VRRRPSRRSLVSNLLVVFLIIAVVRACGDGGEDSGRDAEDVAAIERALTPASSGDLREGIAAVILMDVSGSMGDAVRDAGQPRPKIDVARRAALVLVRQFDAYARAHPDEPVVLGLFEFSRRENETSSRPVIPLSPADPVRAEAALVRMRAQGGTPIGDAMIAGTRALDASGLARRHLMVVTDGENTDGYEPAAVMSALQRRPDSERPSVYFVAFDIAASRFETVREAGGLVLGAGDAEELNATLESLLTGKILVEGP
jgi:Mg-chelatase subunit ChlD